ncbi:alpha/beta fold hydrolase [Amycolatopsis suaedae]|uniref:Alpha/beta hydrolase n=1 Tax=Amycolatopsis suaedae TaxID=2510978 RepID=A0A4Q7J175_9PSEU|nr:alpha/beta hydrolase [Amycolatopsis suaedae]RZQ60577.1 alpha/beta hydrolase [Amycolatopsis suaedae]
MKTTTSADGTTIAYEVTGSGPPLVLVDGALCYREQGPARALARELAGRFTVYAYDRRGRGDSGTGELTVEREVEDLEAVVKEAGGAVSLFGCSSGAVLALEAADRGVAADRLALYEAPFIVDGTHPPMPAGFVARVRSEVDAGRGGEAVKMFMRYVGAPGFFVALMRLFPVWRKLTAVAPTLLADLAMIEPHQKGEPLPAGRWSSVTMPVLVADGGKSPEYMRNAQRAIAAVLPDATHRTVPGQTHMVKAPVLAPVVAEFLTA